MRASVQHSTIIRAPLNGFETVRTNGGRTMRTTIEIREWRCTGSYAAMIGGLMLIALLVACSGSTGSQGAAGTAGATGATGPAGPTGAVTALNITNATAITGTITGVKISGQPVVNFELVDGNGAPLTGLPAADI